VQSQFSENFVLVNELYRFKTSRLSYGELRHGYVSVIDSASFESLIIVVYLKISELIAHKYEML